MDYVNRSQLPSLLGDGSAERRRTKLRLEILRDLEVIPLPAARSVRGEKVCSANGEYSALSPVGWSPPHALHFRGGREGALKPVLEGPTLIRDVEDQVLNWAKSKITLESSANPLINFGCRNMTALYQ